jgi:hypothetical protein
MAHARKDALVRDLTGEGDRAMAIISKITRAYVRTYSDSGQTVAYVEWVDNKGETGRTEGKPDNAHMQALLAKAEREGLRVEYEQW